jgi:hypothetical protein
MQIFLILTICITFVKSQILCVVASSIIYQISGNTCNIGTTLDIPLINLNLMQNNINSQISDSISTIPSGAQGIAGPKGDKGDIGSIGPIGPKG